MIWKKFFALFLSAPMLMGQTLAKPHESSALINHASVDEVLSYSCAKSLGSLVDRESQVGPLFSEGHLIFTSLEAKDLSKLLLLNAGAGNFVVALEGSGVNRIRFALPSEGQAEPRQFFLSYIHGYTSRSRYFEFSEGRPPFGREEDDYALVIPSRTLNMQPHLEYAIHETSEAILHALTDGKIDREHLSRHAIVNCDHIANQSPQLATNLRHNLNTLDIMMVGPKPIPTASPSRLPASLATPVIVNIGRR